MTVIVCVDDNEGMMFGSRRQSRDTALCDRILNDCMGKKLYMDAYSYKMFSEREGCSAICDGNYLDIAGDRDICFVERDDITHLGDRIDKIIMYRWNRVYPATLYFKFPSGNWVLESECEIGGTAHDITERVYVKK